MCLSSEQISAGSALMAKVYVLSFVFLLLSADPGAQTLLDKQTPLHYATKNDAVGSIRLLLQAGASISCTDYRQRTPLQLAAIMGEFTLTHAVAARIMSSVTSQVESIKQLKLIASAVTSSVRLLPERSEAAQVLLELGADAAVQDCDGQLCITALIGRMSHVVIKALPLEESSAFIAVWLLW